MIVYVVEAFQILGAKFKNKCRYKCVQKICSISRKMITYENMKKLSFSLQEVILFMLEVVRQVSLFAFSTVSNEKVYLHLINLRKIILTILDTRKNKLLKLITDQFKKKMTFCLDLQDFW